MTQVINSLKFTSVNSSTQLIWKPLFLLCSTVPQSVDVLLGVLHHLLELVGASDLCGGFEVGPVLLAQLVLLQQVLLQPRVHLEAIV